MQIAIAYLGFNFENLIFFFESIFLWVQADGRDVVEKEHDTVRLRPEVFEKTFDVFAAVKVLG